MQVFSLSFPKSFSLDHASSCYWAWPSLVDITMSNTWETWLQNNEEIWSHPKCNLSENLIKQHRFPIQLFSSFSSLLWKHPVSSCSYCSCILHSRGCYVNVETYTKVFSDKQDWKNIWNMIIRGSRHKRVHRLSIGGWGHGEQMSALSFVTIQ